MLKRIAALSIVTLIFGAPAVGTSAGAALPAGFGLRAVLTHLNAGVGGIATAFAYAPDGRIFVGRKTGIVDVYDGGVRHVFLDLTTEVNSSQGRGLLGLALDPHFTANGRVYVAFTQSLHPRHPDSRKPAGGEIISIRGIRGDHDTADLTSRVTLLTGYNSSAAQHADGALRFDHAGLLYAGFGDATADAVDTTALHAQDLGDLRGKIVRIDPRTGKGVPGNPYYNASQPGSVRSKVYAFGLRNPYRFTVDQQNGTLYVGDVGWSSFDELDAFVTHAAVPNRDRNGGWPCYEGASGHSAPESRYENAPATRAVCLLLYPPSLHGTGLGAHAPLYAYAHGTGACIIAGPKYTGTANYPTKYTGKVFIADWARDTFQTVNPVTGGAAAFGTAGSWGQPLDIQIAPDGNVAYLALATNSLREISYRA